MQSNSSFVKQKRTAQAALALAVCGLVGFARADYSWGPGDNTDTHYWDDSNNWTGSSGNYVLNPGYASTVTFRTLGGDSISTGLWIENGLDYPITLTAPSTDYGLTMTGSTGFWVGSNAGDGACVIDGGTYHFANDIGIGSADGKTGKLTLKSGRLENAYWFVPGYSANSVAEVLVEGGEVVVGYRDGATAYNSCLELGRGTSSTVTFTQTGGTVSAEGGGTAGNYAISIGSGSSSTATYTISGGTLTARGYFTYLGVGSGSTGTLNLYGGVVEPVILNVGSGTGIFNWNGGTLRATEIQDILPANDSLTVTIGENGGTLDSNGLSTTMSAALHGSGNLVKTGAGPLILTSDLSDYTGTIILSNGVLRIADTYALTNLTVTSGTTVYVEGDNATNCTSQAELIALVAGSENAWTVEEGGRVVGYNGARSDTETAVTTEWIGGYGLFATASNWTLGVPTSTDTALFTTDADVRYEDNAEHSLAELVISNDARVVIGPNSEGNYPATVPTAISGEGTLIFRRSGINAAGNLAIPDTVDLEFTSWAGSTTGYDSWLQGNDYTLTVNGTATVDEYLVLYKNTVFNGPLVIADGARVYCQSDYGSTRTFSEVSVPEGATGTLDGTNLQNPLVKTGLGTLSCALNTYPELVLKEGTVSITSDYIPSNYFEFQGGTLQIASDSLTVIDDYLIPRLNAGTNHTDAIKIDTAGYDITFNTALGSTTTTNGFVKQGAGSLTLTAQPAYTGDTTVEEGYLYITPGLSLPGTLSIADGAALAFAVDDTVWTAGYTTNLFTYSALAEGLTLTAGENLILDGLSENLGVGITTTTNDDGTVTVTATVTGEQFVWNGASGADWLAEGVWKGKTSDAATSFTNAYDVIFDGTYNGSSLSATTNAVAVSSEVKPATIYGTMDEGVGYRFTGSSIVATRLAQTGAGDFIFTNEAVTVDGTTEVSAGSLVLEGSPFTANSTFTVGSGAETVLAGGTLTANGTLAVEGTVRATGETESLLVGTASGSGAYQIDDGATLTLGTTQAAGISVTGTGTLNPTNGQFTVGSTTPLSAFEGTLRIGPTASLSLQSGLNDSEHYDLGASTTLLMAGGSVSRFAINGGGNNNVWLGGKLVLEEGTTSTLYNYTCRQNASRGANLRVNAAISGAGTATFYSSENNTAWQTTLNGDNTSFTGVMNLSGYTFNITTAAGGSPNGTWNFTSANTFYLSHASGTTMQFGALNVTQSGATVAVSNSGALELGSKANCTIEGAITGSPTITKVGSGTTLMLNGDASGASVVANEGSVGGTGTIAALSIANGVTVTFADLSDITATYSGLRVLAEPSWNTKPTIANATTDRGHWVLSVVESTETINETSTTVYTLTATFKKNGIVIKVR